MNRTQAIDQLKKGKMLMELSPKWRDDFFLVHHALIEYRVSLQDVSDRLRDNFKIVWEAVKYEPEPNAFVQFQFASERLRANADMVWHAISHNPRAAAFADTKLFDSQRFAIEILNTYPDAAEYNKALYYYRCLLNNELDIANIDLNYWKDYMAVLAYGLYSSEEIGDELYLNDKEGIILRGVEHSGILHRDHLDQFDYSTGSNELAFAAIANSKDVNDPIIQSILLNKTGYGIDENNPGEQFDKDFLLRALRRNGEIYKSLKGKCLNDVDIAAAAVKSNPQNITYVLPSVKNSNEFKNHFK